MQVEQMNERCSKCGITLSEMIILLKDGPVVTCDECVEKFATYSKLSEKQKELNCHNGR
jgi:hypothetical protein